MVQLDTSQRLLMAFTTQGTGGNEEARIRQLLRHHEFSYFPFDRRAKIRSCWNLFCLIRKRRPALVVMEGTGLAGGLALLLGRWLAGTPYVVSSGDAVGPWVATHYPWLGPFFGLYERMLCYYSGGFIGWTPYLAGRAFTFGRLGPSLRLDGRRTLCRLRSALRRDERYASVLEFPITLWWSGSPVHLFGPPA